MRSLIQDTPIWDKYSVKYTQLNIQFGRAHNIQLSPEVEVVLVFANQSDKNEKNYLFVN